VYISTIFFILKQGYMFRLKVSHLQALTTFSLPGALPTLGSHSVVLQHYSYRTEYRTVPTSRRRYTHPRCRTSPTTRNDKPKDKTTKYVTTTKTAGKLYPTIPCNNPESDTGWKTQQSSSNRKNRRTPTSAIIRQRNSQLNIRWSSTHG